MNKVILKSNGQLEEKENKRKSWNNKNVKNKQKSNKKLRRKQETPEDIDELREDEEEWIGSDPSRDDISLDLAWNYLKKKTFDGFLFKK